MTNNELITAAAIMRRKNAAAKKTIQAKRSRDAKTIARTAHKMNHSNFPTYYKYG